MTPAGKLATAKAKILRKIPANRSKRKPGPFACRIRALRGELNLSLQDVAKAIAMSPTGLWAIEYGSDPQLTTAYKLAEFFGKTVPEIWSKR